MKPTALVTGASGFIASHLIGQLVNDGWMVRTCSRGARPGNLPPGVDHRSVDLAAPDGLADLVRGVSHVFHLAGASSSFSNEADMHRSNVVTTMNLVDACDALGSQLRRFLYVSTSAVYGEEHPLPSPVPEDVEPQPSRPYGRTKWEAEGVVWEHATRGLPAIVVRPVSVYGPRAVKLVASLILDAAIERRAGLLKLEVPADPVELRVVHINDLAAACLHLIDVDDAVGHAFNIASADYPSSHELAAMVAAEFDLGLQLSVQGDGLEYPERARLRDLMIADGMDGSILLTQKRVSFLGRGNRNNRLDIGALLGTGFTPRMTDLRSGIRGTITWYRQHRWIV